MISLSLIAAIFLILGISFVYRESKTLKMPFSRTIVFLIVLYSDLPRSLFLYLRDQNVSSKQGYNIFNDPVVRTLFTFRIFLWISKREYQLIATLIQCDLSKHFDIYRKMHCYMTKLHMYDEMYYIYEASKSRKDVNIFLLNFLNCLFEYTCNFWNRIPEILRDKTYDRECGICLEKKKVIVSECGHCACIKCFKRLQNCHICRTPIDDSKLITLENALEERRHVYT
jgi:hypothetical protein